MSTTLPPVDIPPFEGHDVTSTTIAIRNTGHGLEQAMEVAPAVFHHGDKVHVVLECEVEKIRHDTTDDDGQLVRVHMLKAGTATFVDRDLVDKHLREMERRIDEAKGNQQLDIAGAELEAAHDKGDHADGLVERCPKCDAEKAAAEDEG